MRNTQPVKQFANDIYLCNYTPFHMTSELQNGGGQFMINQTQFDVTPLPPQKNADKAT